MLEQGRTVVQLTLMPAVASKAAEPVPVPLEPEIEPQEEPAEKPVIPIDEQPPVEPIPSPVAPPVQEVAQSIPDKQSVAEKTTVDSVEQDATLIAEKGVVTDIQITKGVAPVYPRISRRRGEEGTVILLIEVLANGNSGSITVLEPSGYPRLDEAACTAATKSTFIPAKQLGRNIDSTIELPFTFNLTDD